METYEYQTLYEFEHTYWWYRHLHDVLLDSLRQYGADRASKILDAGCGTGQNMENVARKVSSHIYGFDLSEHAAPFWRKRNLEHVCNASINQIPYPDQAFDYVMCADVLECEEVDERAAISELLRVVKPGGYLFLVVPAFQSLMSPSHHRAVHAVRRYSKMKVASLFADHPAREQRIFYLFAPVFPMVALYRWWLRFFPGKSARPPRSELGKLPSFLNQSLYYWVGLENRWAHICKPPFGSSILAIYQRVD